MFAKNIVLPFPLCLGPVLPEIQIVAVCARSEIEVKTRGALMSGGVDINELYEKKDDDAEFTAEDDAPEAPPEPEAVAA